MTQAGSAPVGERLETMLRAYLEEVARAESAHKLGEGFFGIGRKRGDDPCHERFLEELQAFLDDFIASAPDEDEALCAARFLAEAPQRCPRPKSAYWFLLSAQGVLLPLIGRLGPENAAALRERYESLYPRRTRLPVQTSVLEALRSAEKR